MGWGTVPSPKPWASVAAKQARDKDETDLNGSDSYESGAVRDTAIVVTRLDGTVRDCILTATARKDKDGKMLLVEGVLRDVTELRIREKKERGAA